MMRRRYAIAVVYVHDRGGCMMRVGTRLCTLNSAASAAVILNEI